MIDLSRYKKPALQFSGGKDSLACLYLIKDQLNDVTVYWADTGDGCPETLAVIEEVRAWVPNFVVVKSDSRTWRQAFGMPSDLVPASSHVLGVAYGMAPAPISNRFDCCLANLMMPMHRRMLADGVDLVIRGTKITDTGAVPADGKMDEYDILLPIKDWSHADVFKYLDSVGAPLNTIYEYYKGASAPECLSCTAWWDDGKAAYLKARHPEQFKEYRMNLMTIAIEAQKHFDALAAEVGEEN